MSSAIRNKKVSSQNKTNFYNNKLVAHLKPEQGVIPELEEDVPAGCVMASVLSADPRGWLICDGRAISRQYNPRLFGAIGTTFGAGDGVSSFNLPDYRGAFLRGSGTAAAHTEYTGETVFSTPQLHATQEHKHPITDVSHHHSYTVVSGTNNVADFVVGSEPKPYDSTTPASTGDTLTGITRTNQDIGTLALADSATHYPLSNVNETRPFNYGINWIIKL